MNVLTLLTFIQFVACVSATFINTVLKGPATSTGSFYLALGNSSVLLCNQMVFIVDSKEHVVLVKQKPASKWKQIKSGALDYEPTVTEVLILDTCELDNQILGFDAEELMSLTSQQGIDIAYGLIYNFKAPPVGQFTNSFVNISDRPSTFIPPFALPAHYMQYGNSCAYADDRSITIYRASSSNSEIDPTWLHGSCCFTEKVFSDKFESFGKIIHVEKPGMESIILVHLYGEMSVFAVTKNGDTYLDSSSDHFYKCSTVEKDKFALMIIFEGLPVPSGSSDSARFLHLITERHHVGILN